MTRSVRVDDRPKDRVGLELNKTKLRMLNASKEDLRKIAQYIRTVIEILELQLAITSLGSLTSLKWYLKHREF